MISSEDKRDESRQLTVWFMQLGCKPWHNHGRIPRNNGMMPFAMQLA